MERPSDKGIQVVRSSTGYRVGGGVATASALLLCTFFAVTDDVRVAGFAIVAAFALADTLRSEVRVDLDRRMVFSRRAIRTWSGAFDDIDNVRVPPWGPIVLTLNPRRAARGAGLRRGQVITGVQAQRTGSSGQASRLADLLDVEVVSVWPQVKPGPGGAQRSLRDLLTAGPDSTSSAVVAVAAVVCVGVIVGLATWGIFGP